MRSSQKFTRIWQDTDLPAFLTKKILSPLHAKNPRFYSRCPLNCRDWRHSPVTLPLDDKNMAWLEESLASARDLDSQWCWLQAGALLSAVLRIRIRSNPDPTIKSHITRSKSNKLIRYFCEKFTRTSSSSRRTSRRMKWGREGGRIMRKKNLLFKIIPFLLLRIRIQTLKYDLDPVKSRPDPQHWLSARNVVPYLPYWFLTKVKIRVCGIFGQTSELFELPADLGRGWLPVDTTCRSCT